MQICILFTLKAINIKHKILYYDNTMQKIYSIDTENGIAKLVSNL